jgi:heme ABC exporter ATP-binding subunit CcmA
VHEQTAPQSIARATSLSSAPPSGRPRLVLHDVTKRWRASDPPLFEGIDLELSPGTFAVVAGRNGAGKTTLLRIVAGMISPDRGVVRLEGLSPRRNRRAYHRRVGFLSAGSTGLYGRLTVAQHLAYWARLAFVPAGERDSKIAAALSRFELEDIVDRRANRLSMGQRQRLTLALAFLHDPLLVLLDEPWNSLDGQGIELANAVATEFASNGGTVLVCVPTGHELELIPPHTPYELEGGRLERIG